MYLQEIEKVLDGQFVNIKYDCNGDFERCGKEWSLKLRDARKNYEKNEGKHICHKCQLKLKNPMNNKEVRDKIKKTNLERYGTACALNTKENIDARNKKMFGTQEAIDARTAKTIETNLAKYGVEHAAQSEEKKQKALETFREKYGTDHPMQNEEVKDKTRKTTQERYGVDNVLSVPEVRAKAALTSLERYGVEHYNQLPEMKEYLRQNCTTWLEDSYANPWSKGITRPEEWNDKQRETIAALMEQGIWKSVGHKHSIKDTYQSDKCRKKVSIFRSSYELKAHWYVDNDPNVDWYDYEPFQIVYYDTEGKKRYYTIDFVIKYINVDKFKAVEVKNNYTKDSDMTRNKYKAFMEHCGDELDHEFWANEKIESLNLDLKKLIASDRVSLWE